METKEMNIFQKLGAITNELGFVAKNLNVAVSKNNSYKATGEVDVLEAVKPLENKYGVYSYATNREIIANDILTQNTQYGERTSLFLRMKVTYRFVNTDNPKDYIETISFAEGIDSGDKASGKAMTYADKYALMKTYKISTGEDPDQKASEEYKKPTKKVRKETNNDDKLEFINKYYKDHREKFGRFLKAYLSSNNAQKVSDLNDNQKDEIIQAINNGKHTFED